MKRRTVLVAVVLSLVAPATVMAQTRPWLSDRVHNGGMGIRTGDLELHPSVAGEVGYDSNYFQRSGDSDPIRYPYDGIGRSSALRFRLTPSLSLSTLGAQRTMMDTSTAASPSFTFAGTLFASYNEMVGLSGPDDYGKQRHVDGGANLQVMILPRRPISADVTGSFTRMVSPSNDPAVANSWNRDTFRGGLGVTWRPGGGLFDWRFGYDVTYNYFEADSAKGSINVNNNINTRGRWKFYPRTALISDAQTYWVNFPSSTPARNSGQVIQARLGLSGLMTNQLSLTAVAGWAATYFRQTVVPVPENLNTVVGQTELRWLFQPDSKLQPGDATVGLSSVGFGYVRDFSSSYLADYYQRDRVYADSSYLIGGQVVIDVQTGYSHISHPRFVRPNVGPVRALSENRVDAQAFVEYRMSDTVGINTTLRYDASLTRANVPLVSGYDNLAFSRFAGWVGVRWFM
jgi:hypothetical protein